MTPRVKVETEVLRAAHPPGSQFKGYEPYDVQDLQISARTVEVHRANVMTKMGASTLSDLLRMVFIARSAGVV